MPEGKVKKIVADKGFGFIEAANMQDVFFHHSTVDGQGFDNLVPGQPVEYELDGGGGRGGKGPRASTVKPLQS